MTPASVALIVLGLVIQLNQSAQRASRTGPGIITGLGAELLARNLPVPMDAGDLDRPITSYSVLDDSRGFVIAYYAQEPG